MKEMMSSSAVFGVWISLGAYYIGVRLKRRFQKWYCNPFLIAVLLVVAVLLATGVSYDHYYEGAKNLTFFLTPTTACLALPLYRQRELLKDNVAAVLCGLFAGVLSCLLSVFLLALVFRLSHTEYVTLLPKSITAAFAIGVSQEMGGMVPITMAAVTITGILGSVTADISCRLFRITEPIAKGLAMGASAHALGVAHAMEESEIEGAMGSLAMAAGGIMTVILVPYFAGLL